MKRSVSNNKLNWHFTIDAGQCSMGLSAIEYVDHMPERILSAVSWIHDGGKDASTGKSPRSRKAIAGEKRRSQRMETRRRTRLTELRNVLESCAIPAPSVDKAMSVDPWEDRALLVESKIVDEREMKERLGRAVMHIARNRGWRNAWWSVEQVSKLAVPSASFLKIQSHAAERLRVSPSQLRTLGQIGYLSVNRFDAESNTPLSPLRFRAKMDEETGKITPGGMVVEKVRQEDLIEELRLICETQGLSDELFKTLRSAVFDQAKPTVGEERVGRDPFDKSQLRAHRATLEFQEFRIRDKVANLRIKKGNTKTPLPKDKYAEVVNLLLQWDEATAPTWLEVASRCGLLSGEEKLVDDSVDGSYSSKAPVDETSRLMRASVIAPWWNTAEADEKAEFVAAWVETVEIDNDADTDEDIVAKVLHGLTESELEQLESLKFASGRSAYGRESLRKLNEAMARLTCDQTTARWDAFSDQRIRFGWKTEEDARRWIPPKATFDEVTGNPTVDINIGLARRFLMTATAKWGTPSKVIIRHSADAFMSPQKALEYAQLQKRRERENDAFRTELISMGEYPSRINVLRLKKLMRQRDECLYCGAPITFKTSVFGHIVSRTSGGSNRESNLILTCESCWIAKGDIPFGLWAKHNSKGVTLDAAIERVKHWNNVGMVTTTRQSNKEAAMQGKKRIDVFDKFKSDVISLLKRVTNDDPLDEYAVASIAWSATAIRERVEEFLERQPDYDKTDTSVRVRVYNGRVNGMAREASGFSKAVALRGQSTKTRMDRRHHALDAIILSSLTPSVAKTLVQREDMKEDDDLRSMPTGLYKQYGGWEYADKVLYRRWLLVCKKLAELTTEALESDAIPVAYMSRTSPYYGNKHKDGVESIIRKHIGDAFTKDEINRVIDKDVYMSLFKEASLTKQSLGVNPDRSLVLPGGRVRKADDVVDLFASPKAMLPRRNGAVGLNYIHHARVYAWKTKTADTNETAYAFGIIRVFAGEFGRIGFLKKGVDVFHQPLPVWSESWRVASPTVIKMITRGKAVQIGWLMDGDELEFNKSCVLPGEEGTPSQSFSEIFPDRRFVVAGFMDATHIRLRPSYLSDEGIDEIFADLPLSVQNIISGEGWKATVSKALADPELRVLRRSILGVPRWKDSCDHKETDKRVGRLPKSWQPIVEARRLLG